MGRTCSSWEGEILIRKHEGKKPFGRLWCACEDNIKMNIV